MKNEDRMAFVEVVVGFAELKGKALSGPALELYWRAMEHWDLEDFRTAAAQLLRTCEFMPTPADFEKLRKAGRNTAGEAFHEAVQWCASSAYRNGPHPDPIVNACVRAIGGYQVIAMAEADRLPFLERRFAEHFEHISDAMDTREEVPQLAYSGLRISGPQAFGAIASDIGERLGGPSRNS